MLWSIDPLKYWPKKTFMLPPPILVGIELNPGPGALSEEQRKNIVRWKKDGLGNKTIASKLKTTVKTVKRWVKRCCKPPSIKTSFKNRPGQGRKRKLTKKQEKKVVKKAKIKDEDAPQIAREMSREVPGGVKVDTIRRTLQETGLKYLVRKKLEVITPSQAARRREFARNRLHDEWKYALFVDEKTFQVGGSKHKSWQDPKARKTDKYKRHAPKIHVFGGIGLHFKTQLYFFEETLDADLYCKILNKRLPPAHAFNLHQRDRNKWVLVQDNDPKHKSKKVEKVLDRLAPDRLRDWPSNSPDFNPIEDIWSELDYELQKTGPKDIVKLKSALSKAWKNLDQTKVKSSIESLPRRLEECLKVNGERTRY
jgi:transposase